MTQIDQIRAYEAGKLDAEQTVALFQSLIDSGMAWTLQGHYWRTAMQMIRAGKCTQNLRDPNCTQDIKRTRDVPTPPPRKR